MAVVMWACSVLTIVSAGVRLGYAVAGLRAAHGAERLPSSYALARSAALMVVALSAPVTSNLGFIAAAAVAMICVQSLDAVIGVRSGDRLKTIGPAFTAVANVAALI
ncbi:hypothetical protein K8F61_09405 [Microbacterium resistens]|uniref:Uncharacterized protein n=1 Tax=Microbacterium resistens TaxID=156977 RepID=A0ABY3RZ19_9MICO|nr:hypothetical protein [Microbacterium resistens]UGS28675.1 hypothetical protein K8F61_09405 [Microbacterium resistens]